MSVILLTFIALLIWLFVKYQRSQQDSKTAQQNVQTIKDADKYAAGKQNGAICYNVGHRANAPTYDFTSSSSKALNVKGDLETLHQLEQLLPNFASFVKASFNSDGELPPYVPCRDTLPELYMRYGLWEKAENVICLCISVGAYGHTEYRNSHDNKGHWVADPQTGENALEFLRQRHDASDAALAYLDKNPGTLQSKIYKIPALSGVNHDALVWFCRNSHQIRKEKDGKTNRLYAATGMVG